MGETDPALVDGLLRLAPDDTDRSDEAKCLVLATLDGDATFAEALERSDAATPDHTEGAEQGPKPEPVGAYLQPVTVAGICGVRPERTLRLRLSNCGRARERP